MTNWETQRALVEALGVVQPTPQDVDKLTKTRFKMNNGAFLHSERARFMRFSL